MHFIFKYFRKKITFCKSFNLSIVIYNIYLSRFWFDFQTTSVTVSVLTLSAISVERYFAICKPWTSRLSKRFILRIIACIWLIGFIVSVPDLIYYTVTNTFQESITFYLRYCSRKWSLRDNVIYNLVILIVLYSIPICLMAYTYAIIFKQLWRKDLPGIVEAGSMLFRYISNWRKKSLSISL